MPAPVVVYVVAAISTVAAVAAFKHFVYDPHIAPSVQVWLDGLAERRQTRRQKRSAVAISVRSGSDPNAKRNVFRDLSGKHSDLGDEGMDGDIPKSFELEKLVAKEIDEWRADVEQSQAGLRHRKIASSSTNPLDETGSSSIHYDSLKPTHVLFDTSMSSEPSSGSVTRATPSPPVIPNRQFSSSSTITQPGVVPSGGSPRLAFSVESMARPFSPVVVSPSRASSHHGSIHRTASPYFSPSVPESHLSHSNSNADLQMLSSSSPRVDSPFTMLSHSVLDVLSPSQTISELEFLSASSEEDHDVLSVHSLHSSPSLEEGSVFGDFDTTSMRSSHEGVASDISSWASVHRRRT